MINFINSLNLSPRLNFKLLSIILLNPDISNATIHNNHCITKVLVPTHLYNSERAQFWISIGGKLLCGKSLQLICFKKNHFIPKSIREIILSLPLLVNFSSLNRLEFTHGFNKSK